LFHLSLLAVSVTRSMIATSELNMTPFGAVTTRALEILLTTAFSAAEYEQGEKDQGQHATPNRAANDVLPVARRTRPISTVCKGNFC